MKAKKENKVYKITTESEKQRYLKEGYDIYDDNGNIIEYSPLKKIEYSKYANVVAENTALKTELEELKANAGENTDDSAVVEILSVYANEHEIDLGKATTISGIVKKIGEVKAGA